MAKAASRYESNDAAFSVTVRQRLLRAEKHCRDLGASMTPLRKTVFGILAEYGLPLGAYELMAILGKRTGRRIAPPTVYRAVDFLLKHGLVARVASRNAFVLCAHPEHDHDCIFFICDFCGAAREVEDRRFEKVLRDDAAKLGFMPMRRILEIGGTCRSCQRV